MGNGDSMYPKALLFDMDGVLVDSKESWRGALNGALREYGQKELTREEFVCEYWGADLFEILERLGLDIGIGRFCNSIYPNYIADVRLFDGVVAMLEQLHGLKKAVVTNTTLSCTEMILELHGIKKYFKEIVTSDQVIYGKPHPDMIFLACKRLNVPPEDVILIGDTINDVKAGKGANCAVIGLGIEGDYLAETLEEIPGIIEKIKRSG
ncbi:MAG: HAD family hydrolase [Candidatus Methanofastidiosa archaeon]|nr:HAD family hydrolase [Candidatus Methanofastidiosa archaeon]